MKTVHSLDEIRWHLGANVFPPLSDKAIEGVLDLCRRLNAGEIGYEDIDQVTTLPVWDILEDLKIEVYNRNFMNNKQLRSYSETLVEITLTVGMKYGELRVWINDSMELNSCCIAWAEEFEKLYKLTDWDQVDWIDTIEAFADEKITKVITGKDIYTKDGN